jgi:hypothetical protein
VEEARHLHTEQLYYIYFEKNALPQCGCVLTQADGNLNLNFNSKLVARRLRARSLGIVMEAKKLEGKLEAR